MMIKEFVVNEHISLRLEEKESQDGTSKETNIYIHDRLFRQCKSLIFFLGNVLNWQFHDFYLGENQHLRIITNY